MPVAIWATQKDHSRHSNCKPGKSVRLPLFSLTLFADALSLTSRNLLDQLPSELRNWFIICSNH